MRIIILLFTICLSSFATSQNTTNFEWPENEVTPIFKEFVKAYNTNDSKKIETFLKNNYEKDAVNVPNRALYWSAKFADFGKIEPFIVAEKFSGKNKFGIWFHGKNTKIWVMILFQMNTDNTKISRVIIYDGLRPTVNLPPYTPISADKMKPTLKKYMKKLYKLDRFSGSVLVAKGNTILFEKTYGKSNKKTGAENNANTSFNIASTTKTFTAIALAKLEEQGKLKFTDPISKFIPEYPKDIADQVTIHHLLTHTSGIEIDDYEPFNLDNSKAKSINEALKAQIKHIDSMNEGRRKDFKVLNKYDYSNEEYVLLGAIIERTSGMSYGEYIEQHIFNPLNMKNSFADFQKIANLQNKAIGYTYRDDDARESFIDGVRRESGGLGRSYMAPEGGIRSTTRDLYTYFKAINTHTFISKEIQELLHTKHAKRFEFNGLSEHYGYGFQLKKYGSAITIGHGGKARGVGSRLDYYPLEDYYVIVLSNYGSIAGNAVADHIRDLIAPNN